jgi:L-2-hydroxyglutarate oxidase LhgO
MTALLGDAEAAGALLAVASPVLAARREGKFWRVHTGGTEGMELGARWLINAAGLQAQAIAARMTGFPAAAIPRRHLAKGHYFSLAGSAPFQRLIYPMPVDGGLGVHLTLDLGGQARFGPDVEWLSPPQAGTAEMDGADAALDPTPAAEGLDFQVDPARAAAFYAAIRHYWPELRHEALQPAYSGIRPKLSGPGEPARDFHIAGPAQHGCAGVLQLFGIESPGLTASLAIARHVRGLMQLA